MSDARPWLLLCKPVRAPFRDGTSVLVRNMLRALPSEVEVVYFGDPDAPVRGVGDRVVAATAMAYQPSLKNKLGMLARMVSPRLSRLPIHSFFAPNRSSAQALDLLRRLPRRRPVLQTLPASTGAESVAALLDRLDRVVVTSDWGRRQLIAADVDAGRVVRVYPGVEIPATRPGPPIDSRRAVLFAGDLDEEVGRRLLDVAAALRSADHWRLVIATRPKGDDHARVREELGRALGPDIEAGRVELLGEVGSMSELFDRAALQLYLASHARKKVDIPFVLIEGMARGVPVAIVDADPVRELLARARAEALEVGLSLPVQARRFRAAVEELPLLLGDGARMLAMSQGARALAERRFCADEMAASYRRHYRELS